MSETLEIEGYQVELTNLDKIFWPKINLTKGDLINYYIRVGGYILPYLRERPFAMNPYPDGINGKSFYQKRCPEEAPEFITRAPIYSRRKDKNIEWIVINNLASLVWAANRACIDLHIWFSKWETPESPDFAVFDLDPHGETSFVEAADIALKIKKIIESLDLKIMVKTSGKRGLHLYIPVAPLYRYSDIRSFLYNIALPVVKKFPDLATLEWKKKKRGNRVYIDFRQNGRGKTLPAPYSLRAVSRAVVSTPVTWDELVSGVSPGDFNINNLLPRIKNNGDIFKSLLTEDNRQELPEKYLN